MITSLLEKYQHQFGSIFDFEIIENNSIHLDLAKSNPLITSDVILDARSQEEFIFDQIRAANARVGVGGYLEHRKLYQRGTIFDKTIEPRSIHLGIDLWTESGTLIFAPIEGEIFSIKNNEGTGDYGPTIILKHRLEESSFYTLYGHLTADSLIDKKVGDLVLKGEDFCQIGNYPINGDWAPHLHFQIITNLDDFRDGDYPAVCTKFDLEKFAKYCPNPNLILRIPNL